MGRKIEDVTRSQGHTSHVTCDLCLVTCDFVIRLLRRFAPRKDTNKAVCSIQLFLICFALLFSGCAHVPIKTISQEETKVLVSNFENQLAIKYEIVSSVVFKYRFFSLSSLGVTSVDLKEDYLAAAGITPVGITLFKVESKNNKIVNSFVIPELKKHGDVAKAVSENIHDIYFDLVPNEIVSSCSKKGKIYLKTLNRDELQNEYVFSLESRMLIEKRLYKKGRLFLKVLYGNWFADSSRKMHAGDIRLIHKKYKYQILLNVKEAKSI